MPAVPDSALALLAPAALATGALLQLFIARLFSSRVKGMFAVLACIPALAVVAWLTPAVQSGGSLDAHVAGDGLLAIVVHVDALSVLFAGMGTLLGAIVLLYSVAYMEHDRSATRFYAIMQVFIGAFVAMVFCANLFYLYLCWEIIGLCSFSLVGFWYTQREAVEGARKVLLMTHVAGYGLLAAILVLYQRTGTALWTDPSITQAFTGGVFLLMLIALVAKSVQVPLHTWIPDAMAAPTPVSSLLHAACYVTAGVYLAARMRSFGTWHPSWNALLILIGMLTMVVGVMYAMVQTDLKRMLAFSTVSQIGYMMLGIGIGTPLAITAGLLHCLNHGFFKGGLFLNAGAVQHAAGTRDMNQLGGLAQRMPRTTLWWLIGVGNMAGIPLMSGFVSKWMLYAAALQAGWTIPALVALLVSLGTVFLCAKATAIVFLGPATDRTREAHEAPAAMQWAMGLMAVGSIVLGVAPQLAVNYLLNPILPAFGLAASAQVTWLGIFAGAGTFSTTGGLVLALVSLLGGAVIYALAAIGRPVHARQAVAAGGGTLPPDDVFTGGEPLSEMGRLTARDFSDIFEHNWKSFFRSTNVDWAYQGIWSRLRSLSTLMDLAVSWMEQRALVLILGMSAVLLLGVGFLARPVLSAALSAPPLIPALPAVACAVSAGALVLAAAALGRTRLGATVMVIGGAAVSSLLVESTVLRFALLEAAALLTIVPVWQFARTRSAKVLYACVVVLSATLLGGAEVLAERGVARWAAAFLITGVVVKFAAVPFFVWLVRLADELPALVLGLIIGVVDMAAVGELYVWARTAPGTIAPNALWLGVAAASSLIAAILMLTQNSLKRLLVLSTVEDVGFLLLGFASARSLAITGMLIAAATHSLAKALLFGCVSAPEADGALELQYTGIASRYPVSAFGFVIGMLAMLGVPSTMGYPGRWRLYSTALEIHPLLLLVFVVSSILALFAYVRALTRVWWGSPHHPEGPSPIMVERRVLCPPVYEPMLLKFVLIALSALLLLGGLLPQWVMQLAQGGRS